VLTMEGATHEKDQHDRPEHLQPLLGLKKSGMSLDAPFQAGKLENTDYGVVLDTIKKPYINFAATYSGQQWHRVYLFD